MEKVREVVGTLRNNAFMRNNAIYWCASLGVSFINYLYYPILGRLLSPTAFGETQTIISFFTQAAVFFQVLGLLSIGIINKYEDEETRDQLTSELSRLALALSVILLVLTILFSPLLAHFFRFQSVSPFLALAASLLVSVPLAFANAYLQGHHKFWKLSIGNLISSTSKIILAVIFVELGFGSFGAVGGLVCAQLVALVYSLKMGRGLRHFVASNLHLRKPQLALIKPELPYAGMVFVTSLTTNLLLSFDILVVKHYFPPAEAGLYTGISIISNIVYFVTGPFAAVLVASIKVTQSRADNLKLLYRSLLLVGLVGGSATIIFLIVPHLVVGILLGHKYSPYATYLRGLSIALFTMSIANVFIYYHIGLRHFLLVPIVLLGLFTTLGLLFHAHSTMTLVVRDLVIGAIVLLVMLVGLTAFYGKEGVA